MRNILLACLYFGFIFLCQVSCDLESEETSKVGVKKKPEPTSDLVLEFKNNALTFQGEAVEDLTDLDKKLKKIFETHKKGSPFSITLSKYTSWLVIKKLLRAGADSKKVNHYKFKISDKEDGEIINVILPDENSSSKSKSGKTFLYNGMLSIYFGDAINKEEPAYDEPPFLTQIKNKVKENKCTFAHIRLTDNTPFEDFIKIQNVLLNAGIKQRNIRLVKRITLPKHTLIKRLFQKQISGDRRFILYAESIKIVNNRIIFLVPEGVEVADHMEADTNQVPENVEVSDHIEPDTKNEKKKK